MAWTLAAVVTGPPAAGQKAAGSAFVLFLAVLLAFIFMLAVVGLLLAGRRLRSARIGQSAKSPRSAQLPDPWSEAGKRVQPLDDESG